MWDHRRVAGAMALPVDAFAWGEDVGCEATGLRGDESPF